MPVDVDLTVAPARGRAQATVAAASPQTSVGPSALVEHVTIGDPHRTVNVGAGHTGLKAGPGRRSRGE